MSVSKCFIVNMIFTEIQFLVNQLAQNTQDFPDILLFQILWHSILVIFVVKFAYVGLIFCTSFSYF